MEDLSFIPVWPPGEAEPVDSELDKQLMRNRRIESACRKAAKLLRTEGGKRESTNRRGRPKNDEKSKDEIVIGLLAIHHQYESGGCIGNWDPASIGTLLELDEKKSVSCATISRFFKKHFENGHAGYCAACNSKAPRGIGTMIAVWRREPIMDHKGQLLPHDGATNDIHDN